MGLGASMVHACVIPLAHSMFPGNMAVINAIAQSCLGLWHANKASNSVWFFYSNGSNVDVGLQLSLATTFLTSLDDGTDLLLTWIKPLHKQKYIRVVGLQSNQVHILQYKVF